MAKSKKVGLDGEMGEVEFVRKPKADKKNAKAKAAQMERQAVERNVEALDALVAAEAAADPIAETQKVVAVFDNMAALAALKPVRPSAVTQDDLSFLLADVVDLQIVRDQAEELQAEGRKFKGMARDHMNNVVNPLKDQAAKLLADVNGWEQEIKDLTANIREDLFADPQIKAAVEALKDHPMWAAFCAKIENMVMPMLTRDHAALLADRDAGNQMLAAMRVEWDQELAKANEWGKAGAEKFFEAETMLKAAGFDVKPWKDGKSHK